MVAVTKMRISCHSLPIEVGVTRKYLEKRDFSLRSCKASIGDEVHFPAHLRGGGGGLIGTSFRSKQ